MMEKKGNEKLLAVLLPLSAVAAIFAAWSVAALAAGSEYILPSVGATFSALFGILKSGVFYVSLSFTLLRTAVAFVISFSLAFALSYASYKSEKLKKFLSPFVAVTRALPTVAVVLLLLFWTDRFIAPVVVTVLVVFPITFTGFFSAFSSIDGEQAEMLYFYGSSKSTVLKKVIIPQIKPAVYLLIGTGLSLNLKLMVAGEVLSQTVNSIGNLLNAAKNYYEIANMIALVVVTVCIGAGVEKIFSRLSEKAGAYR